MTSFLPCDTPIDQTSPLAGTVKPFSRWFLLEEPPIPGAEWSSHEVDNALERDARLRTLQAQVPGSQVLFIRQREKQHTSRRFFVVDPQRETLHAADISSWDALAAVDAHAETPTLNGSPMQAVTEPLYVVCTNARRDCRCGEVGIPVYEALREQVGAAAWEATHITGHKFAATLYVFPQAICYGRLLPAHIPHLLAAQADERLLLDHYRGRSAYAQPVQIAEHRLLSAAERAGMHDFELLSAETQGTRTLVTAKLAHDPTIHRLTVTIDANGFSVVAQEAP